jgi:hypothetical protein
MKLELYRPGPFMRVIRQIAALICAGAIMPGDMNLLASQTSQPPAEQAASIPPEQLESLVAPIALYPDPLLSQTLVASTYPLEIIQLQQWLQKNKTLKDKALADAVQKEPWDASIQAMAALPDVVKQLAENIKWTTDLGNAFLAQQSDVMDAVQRMRKKAQTGGNLKSSEQQKVETKEVASKEVIIIEQKSPEVVYVPSYNPTVVYGAPAYPYPPIAYPPPGYYAAGMAISFGVGIAMGAAWGGGWGYNSGWGGGNNNININTNNNFVKSSNRQNVSNRTGGGNSWQHNPQHRGGAPYSNGATAKKFGGTARGDSMTSRQTKARENQGQRGGGLQQAGDRDSLGSRQQPSKGDRSASGNRDRSAASDRSSSGRDPGSRDAGASNKSASRGNGDRVGNRSTSDGGGSRNSGALGGGSGGSSGKSARASSSRGSSSMSGGGSRGGGGRSGGGGRRR